MSVNYKIGEYSYGEPSITGDGTIEIGKFTSIANNVNMILWGHRVDMFTTFPFGHTKSTNDCVKDQNHLIRGKIIIGNDVWIGTNATILYGSVIGDGCVISSGSVVRGKIKPYSLVAGNPAERLFFRFEKKIIDLLLELKWWDLPYEIIRENYQILMSKDYDRLLEFYKNIKEK